MLCVVLLWFVYFFNVIFHALCVVRVLRVLRCGVVCTGVVVDPSVLRVVCALCLCCYEFCWCILCVLVCGVDLFVVVTP